MAQIKNKWKETTAILIHATIWKSCTGSDFHFEKQDFLVSVSQQHFAWSIQAVKLSGSQSRVNMAFWYLKGFTSKLVVTSAIMGKAPCTQYLKHHSFLAFHVQHICPPRWMDKHSVWDYQPNDSGSCNISRWKNEPWSLLTGNCHLSKKTQCLQSTWIDFFDNFYKMKESSWKTLSTAKARNFKKNTKITTENI